MRFHLLKPRKNQKVRMLLQDNLLNPPQAASWDLTAEAMEEERLARLASRKRERSISPPPTRSPRKAPKLEETTTTLSSGARLTMFSSLVDQDQTHRKSPIANAANNSLKSAKLDVIIKNESSKAPKETAKMVPGDLIYPSGVVKSTWAFGHERTGNEIKLEEVLEAPTLRIAVLSAYQWDTDWVLSKLKVPSNGGTTKCVFVMQAKEDKLRQQMMEETEGMRSFLRLCFPPMVGQTFCMHSKLMLLFHPEKLRIAIPTANLLNFDWGETGVMENSVFIIDLPRLPNKENMSLGSMTPFGQEMLYFMEKQGFDQDIKEGVLKFDFTATKEMAFVHTIGGVSYQKHGERTGLPGLSKSIRELGLQTNNLEIDFAASSIGSLNDEFLGHVQAAARGEDLVKRATDAVSTIKSNFFKPATTKPSPTAKSVRDQFRIYFPTKETVRSSTAQTAGTICISRKWYENMPFPRACFRDYRSVRKGMLSHNKILYARGKRAVDGQPSKSEDVAWVYVGSSNMSESAWGKLSFDKKDKAWKTICRNWECGVILPVPAAKLGNSHIKGEKKAIVKKESIDGEDSETESEDEGVEETGDIVGMDVFSGFVDPPFEIPGQVFGDKEPWYFQE